jgi:outer membrane lipoprotein-sorting protein
MKQYIGLVFLLAFTLNAKSQDVNALVQRMRAKMEAVKTYEASGIMKTNVPFLKVPVSVVKIYFKSPDKLKVKNEKGISLVPKGAVSMSLNNLLSGRSFTAIAAGADKVNGVPVKVVKLLPTDENSDIVLSTLYIDDASSLILKARTTTRENGTYDLEMKYGKYAAYALPDHAVFTFNVKEYKLPKGVTFDYDDGTRKPTGNSPANNKGKVEITYNSYIINKGVPDSVFK